MSVHCLKCGTTGLGSCAHVGSEKEVFKLQAEVEYWKQERKRVIDERTKAEDNFLATQKERDGLKDDKDLLTGQLQQARKCTTDAELQVDKGQKLVRELYVFDCFGSGEQDHDIFYCQECNASHEDCSLIPHVSGCIFLRAKKWLKGKDIEKRESLGVCSKCKKPMQFKDGMCWDCFGGDPGE